MLITRLIIGKISDRSSNLNHDHCLLVVVISKLQSLLNSLRQELDILHLNAFLLHFLIALIEAFDTSDGEVHEFIHHIIIANLLLIDHLTSQLHDNVCIFNETHSDDLAHCFNQVFFFKE